MTRCKEKDILVTIMKFSRRSADIHQETTSLRLALLVPITHRKRETRNDTQKQREKEKERERERERERETERQTTVHHSRSIRFRQTCIFHSGVYARGYTRTNAALFAQSWLAVSTAPVESNARIHVTIDGFADGR